MILDKIDEKRLLIALSDEDMDLLDITFKQLDWKNDYSREVIKNLLIRAKQETGFSSENSKLLIEAIPQTNGCFVLVTLLSNKLKRSRRVYKIKNNTKPIIFHFEDAEALFGAIERIYAHDVALSDSALVKVDDSYYAVLYLNGPVSSKLQAIISEYGNQVGKNFIFAARLLEKGNIVYKDKAVEKIGKYLIR